MQSSVLWSPQPASELIGVASGPGGLSQRDDEHRAFTDDFITLPAKEKAKYGYLNEDWFYLNCCQTLSLCWNQFFPAATLSQVNNPAEFLDLVQQVITLLDVGLVKGVLSVWPVRDQHPLHLVNLGI